MTKTLLILVVAHFEHDFVVGALLHLSWSALSLSIDEEALFNFLVILKETACAWLALACWTHMLLKLSEVASTNTVYVQSHVHTWIGVAKLLQELRLLLRISWKWFWCLLKYWHCYRGENRVLGLTHAKLRLQNSLLALSNALDVHG